MKDYYESYDVTINNLKERFDRLQKQKEDIKFYEDAVVNNFIDSVRNSFNPQFPFDVQFFKSLWKKDNEYHDKNMDILITILQGHLCEKIKEIDNVVVYGYDMYGICVYFTVKEGSFELIIPIKQNISRHNCVFENNGNIDVNWDIGKFRLLKQDERYNCSWTTVWSGYDLDDCDYFNKG